MSSGVGGEATSTVVDAQPSSSVELVMKLGVYDVVYVELIACCYWLSLLVAFLATIEGSVGVQFSAGPPQNWPQPTTSVTLRLSVCHGHTYSRRCH
ncbi:hypothetical protein PIB30_012590 [Stylosanthes scabra]|uniref:Transmembrane protein n=1 Tax=Stylosanthes scabra TaxID=79078 RepID=A0ABU6X4F5_9FABA|nr:hypothetical protein [Stylosanthes scabra]